MKTPFGRKGRHQILEYYLVGKDPSTAKNNIIWEYKRHPMHRILILKKLKTETQKKRLGGQ